MRLLTFAGGKTFYERIEVKVVLYYLKVVSNPANNVAFAEVVNLPKRGVGDVTVKALTDEAEEKRISIWELVERGGLTTALSSKARNGISRFTQIIKDARKLLEGQEGNTIASLAQHIIKAIDLEDFLKKTYPDPEDYESRWENVKELMALAEEADDTTSWDYHDEPLPEVDGLAQNDLSTPLSNFLANISLATDKRAKDAEGEDKPRVTISTIHAAKGLEWPVVFIPGAYDGSIPNLRSEDGDEERRLLYVGMTRAKALLYVSYPLKDSRREETGLSKFLTPSALQLFFRLKGPSFRANVITDIAAILRVAAPPVTFSPDELLLPSQEDDLWPEDGKEKARPPPKWDDWDGTKQRGRPGAPQLVDKPTTAPWKPSYTTTMPPTPAFSTAAALLREQPSTMRGAGSAKRPYVLDDNDDGDDAPHPDKKGRGRPAQRPAGQPSLAAYFGNPGGAVRARAPPVAHLPNTLQLPNPRHRTAAAAAAVPAPAICPSLSAHRIGGPATHPSTVSRRPTVRAATPPAAGARAYVFLLSSPRKPEAQDDGDEVVEVVPPRATTLHTTLHTTTMDRARRGYGAKMGMDGWAKRGGAGGFKAVARGGPR